MIKFWAFIYRMTGWYSLFARIAEYKHIKRRIYEIEKAYNNLENDMDLNAIVGIEIGLWQMEHGFVTRLYPRWEKIRITIKYKVLKKISFYWRKMIK